MNNQSLILLGLGLFVGIFITVVAVDHYLLTEHGPLDPEGLILRAETAFSRVSDLEAILEVSGAENAETPARILVRYRAAPDAALSVRFSPDDPQGEVFTVNRDLLSHYLPQEDLIVIKRWFGAPLAAVGLASLDLAQLGRDWQDGKVKLRVQREVLGFGDNPPQSSLLVSETLALQDEAEPRWVSLAAGAWQAVPSLSAVTMATDDELMQGAFILEVSDPRTGAVVRRVWVDRDTYLVTKTVSYADGQRVAGIRVEKITLNQGLTVDQILTLPQAGETIRG